MERGGLNMSQGGQTEWSYSTASNLSRIEGIVRPRPQYATEGLTEAAYATWREVERGRADRGLDMPQRPPNPLIVPVAAAAASTCTSASATVGIF